MKNSIITLKNNNLFIFTVLLVLFAGSNAFAQKADFSGTWKFVDQESISGNLYINGSPKQIKIAPGKNLLTIESITAGSDGDETSNSTPTLDGKPLEVLNAKTKTVMTIKNFTDQIFTETTAIYFVSDPSKLVYRNTDTWSLEDDKLILDRKSENFTNGENWESKTTYEKSE